MSLHSSLKIGIVGSQQRSVLSRIERLKDLMKKDLWKESQLPTGLPKTKIVRIKAKKAKAEAKEAGAPAAGGKADAAKKPADAAKKAETPAKEKK